MKIQPIENQALGLAELRRQLVQRIEDGTLELPVLPDTAAQVMRLCESGEADARELAALIQRDPSLAGNILRVANSVAFAPVEAIVSLQQAISRLGFAVVRGIAVSVVVQGEVFQVKGHEDYLARLWHHSVCAGAWAKEIARHRRRNVEGAFLCGLLHDVGKAVTLQAMVDLQKKNVVDIRPSVREAWLSAIHTRVGAELVAIWKLPDWMESAVRWHHEPEGAGAHVEEARTASLADILAHWSVESDPEEEEAIEALRLYPVLAELDLYADELDELLDRRETVAQLCASFE